LLVAAGFAPGAGDHGLRGARADGDFAAWEAFAVADDSGVQFGGGFDAEGAAGGVAQLAQLKLGAGDGGLAVGGGLACRPALAPVEVRGVAVVQLGACVGAVRAAPTAVWVRGSAVAGQLKGEERGAHPSLEAVAHAPGSAVLP
jgi:hypothetical protein